MLASAVAYDGSAQRRVPSSDLCQRLHLAHFIPFLLLVAYLLPFYVASGPGKLARLAPDSAWTARLRLIDALKFVYTFIYLLAVVPVLRRHHARVRANFSSLEGIRLVWLRLLVIGGIIVWSAALFFYVLGPPAGPAAEGPIEASGDYAMLGVAAFVYIIGYLGLRQREIFEPLPAPSPPTASPYARSLGTRCRRRAGARGEAARHTRDGEAEPPR